jgi:hypothetical protein
MKVGGRIDGMGRAEMKIRWDGSCSTSFEDDSSFGSHRQVIANHFESYGSLSILLWLSDEFFTITKKNIPEFVFISIEEI